MEQTFENVKNDCVQVVAHGQTVVHSDIDTHDRGGAAKLLSVNTDAVVNSVEAVSGQAHVYGRVNYKVLYLDEESRVCGLDYFAEYDLLVEDEAILAQTTTAMAGILDSECSLVDHVIHLEAVCDVRLVQVVQHTAKVVTSVDCEALTGELTALTLQPVPEAVFEVVEEVESRRSIDRVLLFDARAVHTATRRGVDSTTVEGKIYADVVYRSQGQLCNRQILFDFAEQLDIEGDVDLSVSVRQSRLVLTGEDDNNILRVEVTLAVKGYQMREQQMQTVLDAFCPDADVSLTRDSFVCRRYCGLTASTERVANRVAEQMADAIEVMATTVARVHVANWIAEEGQVAVEGLAVAGVLYLDAEGALQAGEVELPFSVSLAMPDVDSRCQLVGEVTPVGVSADERGDVEMDLLFAIKVYRPTLVSYVTDIHLTPADQAYSVLSVYFAPSDATVWDIAHAVRVSPATLLAQNPSLAEPITGDVRRVTIFRHRELD